MENTNCMRIKAPYLRMVPARFWGRLAYTVMTGDEEEVVARFPMTCEGLEAANRFTEGLLRLFDEYGPATGDSEDAPNIAAWDLTPLRSEDSASEPTIE